MNGYSGAILRVDLTSGKVRKQSLPDQLAREYIGGRGFVARLLWEEVPPDTDPFDPDNPFIVATGPLSGHFMPASGKTHFGCKSPATGGYGDANMGGHFGPALKFAGYDVLVLTGRCNEPGILVIDDDKVTIQPAGEVWGQGALRAEKELKTRLGDDFEIVTIGPAGERLVRYACISHDFGRQAGRCGVGAVLGAKKIKAVAVRGSQSLPVADLDTAYAMAKKTYAHIKKKPGFLGWTPEGTAGITDWVNLAGAFPTRNFNTSYAEHHKQINGRAILERLHLHDKGCFCCPTPCGKYGRTHTAAGQAHVEGPEYETIALFGGACELKTIEEVAYANYLCDELGLDTISAGAVIGWTVECYQKGLLTQEQIGRDIAFGELDTVQYLLDKIAARDGIGDLLAEGVKRGAEQLGGGSADFAIHVKGLEWSGYECRNAPGMMLAYMTADIGAHHNRAWVLGHDVAGSDADVHALISGAGDQVQPMAKAPVGGQAATVIHSQHLRPAFDLLGICRLQFMELGIDVSHYERLFEAITGSRLSWQELLAQSEKVWHLTRAISIREIPTLSRDWDYPPARFMSEPVPDGPNCGHHLSRAEIDTLLDEYYLARGWNRQGRPSRPTLEAHGLGDVADALEHLGR